MGGWPGTGWQLAGFQFAGLREMGRYGAASSANAPLRLFAFRLFMCTSLICVRKGIIEDMGALGGATPAFGHNAGSRGLKTECRVGM